MEGEGGQGADGPTADDQDFTRARGCHLGRCVALPWTASRNVGTPARSDRTFVSCLTFPSSRSRVGHPGHLGVARDAREEPPRLDRMFQILTAGNSWKHPQAFRFLLAVVCSTTGEGTDRRRSGCRLRSSSDTMPKPAAPSPAAHTRNASVPEHWMMISPSFPPARLNFRVMRKEGERCRRKSGKGWTPMWYVSLFILYSLSLRAGSPEAVSSPRS